MMLKTAPQRSISVLGRTDARPPITSLFLREHAPIAIEASQPHRTRIWELHPTLHCSVIGTCLTAAELRQIARKLQLADADTIADHDLHTIGVGLASQRDTAAKLLQKALDRRHATAITRFGKARDAAAVLALWDDSLKQGEVPGGYWAVLTHPAATAEVVKRAFGDVHMLSHLMGAANRADIRRLRQLEEDNAELVAKVERQQRRLRDGFAERDATIRRLNALVAEQSDEAQPDEEAGDDGVLRDLTRRLDRETARRTRLEQRVEDLSARLAQATSALAEIERGRVAALAELAVAEQHLDAMAAETPANLPTLDGETVLYVGGRPNQVPQMRALVERAGGRFLHHDAGIEHSPTLLAGLVSRAQCVLFPTDCISHDAMTTIKRACVAAGKRYQPLRTASLASLLSGLAAARSLHD